VPAHLTLPCLQGLPPVEWLNAFGHAVNTAVQGSRDSPLPLHGEPGRHWRLRLTLHSVAGMPTCNWEQPYVKAKMASASVALPKCRWGMWGSQEAGAGGMLYVCT
jgi:hypothetical protein